MSEARDILLGRTPEEDENAGAGSPIRAALEVTQDRTPEDLLRAKALAQEAGVPEGIALADPDRVQREAVARTIEGNKRFAGWASEPDNAPFARADARALRQVYDNLLTAEEHRALLEADYNYGEKLVVALGQGANQVAVNVRTNRLALLERKIQALETGEPETYRGPGGRPVQRPPRPVDPARLEKMKAEAGELRAALVADRAADVPELGAESVLGNFGLDVARGAPQFLGSIAASLVGTPALGTAFMGSQIAGGQYLDLTEDGVSGDRALAAGLANAALQAPLEALNLGRFVKLLKAKGAVGRVLRAGEQAASEILTETAQAVPELATDIWARAEKDGLSFADQAQKFADELPGALKRGAYEGLTLAPFALIGGLGGAVRAHREERNAQNFVERQLGLHADVDGTLTKQYAPGVLQAALMHSGPEMRQLVSLPVAELLTLHQAGTDILTPLGLSLEEVQTEAAKGGETGVAVPMAALHARLDADRFKAAAKIMRRSAEADSLTEAGKNGENTLKNLEALAGAHAAGAGLLDQEQANSELRARLRRGEAPAPSVASQPESVEGEGEVEGEAIIGETTAEAPATPDVVYAKADVLETYFQTAAQQMPDYDTEVLRADLLEGLGITPEAWEEAMTGGGDLEIDLAAVPKVVSNALWDGMIDHLTVEPSAVTAELEKTLAEMPPPPMMMERAGADVTPETRADLEKRLMAAGRSQAQAKRETELASRMFSTLSRITGVDPNQYIRNALKFGREGAEGAGARLNQPMILAEDATVADFARRVSATTERKKSYFEVKPGVGPLAGVSARLPADTIRHRNKRHPDMTDEDMNRLPEALANLTPERMGLPKKDIARFAGKGIVAWAEVDGQYYGLILESVTPDRIIIGSYFKNTEAGVKAWFEQERDKAKTVTTPAALWPAQAPPIDGDAFRDRSLEENIPRDGQEVKGTLEQPGYSASPNRYNRPSLEHIDSGEGAQTHGWGLYVVRGEGADRKAHVEERYRERLIYREGIDKGPDFKTRINGREYYSDPDGAIYLNGKQAGKDVDWTGEAAAYNLLEQTNHNRDVALKSAREALKLALADGVSDESAWFKLYRAAMEILETAEIERLKPGQVQKWDIPEDDEMLHEDLPLSKQPEKVREAIEQIRAAGFHMEGSDGRLLYKDLVFEMRMRSEANPEESASRLLNQYGIKGIAYEGEVDGPSAVIFDDQAVEVLETFYQAQRNQPQEGAPRGRPWPQNFKVTPLTTIARMKGHADYAAAKAGDREAAARLVLDIMGGRTQQAKLKALAEKYPDAIVVGVHAEEASGRNAIPKAVSHFIAKAAGLEVADDIVQSEKAGRTGKDALYRLAFRARFDGPVQAGRQYVLVDDVVTGGGTLSELRHYIEANGGEVVDMVTAGAAQFSTNIALSEKTRLDLESRFGVESLQAFLKEIGLYGGEYQALTESEARTLLAARTLDAARDRIVAARQQGSGQILSGSLQGRETSGDPHEVAPASVSTPADKNTLFQDQTKPPDSPRGLTERLADGSYRVIFTESADASTAVHEFQHIFMLEALRVMSLPPEQIADQAAFAGLKEGLAAAEAWAGVVDGVWTKEAHEKLARGFEAYLLEGKAPVAGLKKLFSQMKRLLLKLYQTVAGLDVELNAEVRDFFDRQLATEEELAVESWRGEPGLDLDALESLREIDPAAVADYEAAAIKAREAAEAAIIAARNQEHEKLLRQWRREGRAAAKADPRQTLAAEIVARGGMTLSSLEAGGYDADTIRALQKARPGIVNSGAKLGFDVWAQEYNIDSDDFIQALLNTPTLARLQDEYVAEREKEFQDYFDLDVAPTDAELDLWDQERRLWSQYMGGSYRPGSVQALKAAIRGKMDGESVDEIIRRNQADWKAKLKALQAELAHAKREQKANVDWAVAGERAKAKARLLEARQEMALRYQEQIRRQREIARFEAQAKRLIKQNTAKLDKPGGIHPAFHVQIKNLLHSAGIGPEVSGAISLAEFVQELRDQNAGVQVAEWLITGENWTREGKGGREYRRTYRGLSYQEFNDLKNAVENLAFLGRHQQTVMAGGRRQALDFVVNSLTRAAAANLKIKAPETEQQIHEGGPPRHGAGQTVLDATNGYMAALLKIETMCRVLDGGKYGGLWQTTIYEPINRAFHGMAIQTKQAVDDIAGIINEVVGEKTFRDWRGRKSVIPGVPWLFTKEELFMYVMSQGNPQNARLARRFDFNKDGEGINEAQHQALMQAAGKQMFDLAQRIWDYQDNNMYPALNALTLATTGLPLKKVEAVEVVTPFGVYRGGYSPIVFDHRMTQSAERLAARREASLGSLNRFGGSTNAAATNERTGTTYKDLRAGLNFDSLVNSWRDNIYDLNYREATNDLKKILNDPNVRQTIAGAYSEEHLRQFDIWLQEQIKPGSTESRVIPAGINRSIAMIRRNISSAAMGFKFSVAIMQPSGILQSMKELGPVWAAIGAETFYQNLLTGGRGYLDKLYALSPELGFRNALTSFDRDLSDSLGMRNPLVKTLRDKMDDKGFYLISSLDQLTANSIWVGAFMKGQKEGMAEAEAAAYANAVVRTTQGTGANKDLSHAQRGLGFGQLGRIFTQFGTFFSAAHNLIWEQTQLGKREVQTGSYAKAAKRAGASALFFALLPAIWDQFIREGPPEDEEDLEAIGRGVASYFVGGMPIIKDLVNYKLGGSFRFQPAPIEGTIKDMTLGLLDGVQDVMAGEEGGATKIVRGVGGWTGLPSGQITTTMVGLENWDDDEEAKSFYRLLIREPK